MRSVLLPWVLLASIIPRGAAEAQPPNPGRDLELIESTERDEDPLGLDQSTGSELDRAAAALPKPREVLPSASRGAGLSAIDGVRESEHLLELAWKHGLFYAEQHLRLSSSSKHAAEVALRLALPPGAYTTRVRVCQQAQCVACSQAQCVACSQAHCVDASPEPSSASGTASEPGLAIDARPIDDERGHALALRVSPLERELSVQVSWVVEAPVRGGRVRLQLPARGYDPNLAPTELRVQARALSELTPSRGSFDPWQPIEVSASLLQPMREDTSLPCGRGRCTRRYRASPFVAAPPRATWLLIDSSPSMEGDARNRLPPTLAALLAVLPGQSELHAQAFAASTRALGAFRADQAPLAELSEGASLELGAATRLSSFDPRELTRGRPRLLVLSDGRLEATAEERAALRALRRGAELWLVKLVDAPAELAQEFDFVIDVAHEAERALRSGELAALEEALRTIAALPGEPRAGEQRVLVSAPAELPVPGPGSRVLHAYQRHDLAFVRRRTSSAIAAVPYVGTAPPPPAEHTGMPKESVLTMLRTQLVPQARGCLRSDRRGRADYAVSLTFHALFAQREVYEPKVTGDAPEPLKRCLLALLPRLRVPAFSGRIRVRYPIFTEREAVPPRIELEPELGQKLERAFGVPRALP